MPVCNQLEAEIAELDDEERSMFLSEMGMDEPGLDRVIRAGYSLLGLQTYFTAGVKEVRGKGMMIGIELDNDCPELVSKALAAGLVINVTAGNIIRLLPPLNLSDNDAAMLVEKLSTVICDHLAHANS